MLCSTARWSLALIEHLSHTRSQIQNATCQDTDGIVEPSSEESLEPYVRISYLDQEIVGRIAGLTPAGEFLRLAEGDGCPSEREEGLDGVPIRVIGPPRRWIFQGNREWPTATRDPGL